MSVFVSLCQTVAAKWNINRTMRKICRNTTCTNLSISIQVDHILPPLIRSLEHGIIIMDQVLCLRPFPSLCRHPFSDVGVVSERLAILKIKNSVIGRKKFI